MQAPFRAGIQIKDYQLEPVAKALRMPRVALPVADDVGLGPTVEAGLVIHEMLLRHRARRVLVVYPAPLAVKWQQVMRDKFGLGFTILDSAALAAMRRTHGLQANPFTIYPGMLISLPWLRTPRVQRLLDEALDARSGSTPFPGPAGRRRGAARRAARSGEGPPGLRRRKPPGPRPSAS